VWPQWLFFDDVLSVDHFFLRFGIFLFEPTEPKTRAPQHRDYDRWRSPQQVTFVIKFAAVIARSECDEAIQTGRNWIASLSLAMTGTNKNPGIAAGVLHFVSPE